MLDNETKRRIDTARDILVGKVPDPKSQVEQITIALIYKFMDDMDKESVDEGGVASFFTGEYEKYGWRKIFDPRMGGHEMLALYGESITKMSLNAGLPQLFRDIFKNAYLPYRDPETLKLFLKTINEFKYDHSERLGDAFEYLLSVMSSQGDAGQFRTPRHIIDFIVEVMQPKKDESVLDPACGTAGFLISSYKHILNANKKVKPGDLLTPDDRKKLAQNFAGYDISPDMVRLSLVNLYLHGFATPRVYEYDTLTSEDRWNEYYDVIMANPPFMTPKGGIKPHKKFSIQANKSEVLFTDYIMEHIHPVNGRAAIIVPEGIIFQSAGAYKTLRKTLIEKGGLYAVVSLPAGIFQPYSGVKTSILLLDKALAKKTDNILFVKVAADGFSLRAQRKEIAATDLPGALQTLKDYKARVMGGHGVDEMLGNVQVVAKNTIKDKGEYNLSSERYLLEEARPNSWQLVSLDEVCDVRDGTHDSPKYVSSGYPLITSKNLKQGFIDFDDVNLITREDLDAINKRSKVDEGDILMPMIGTIGNPIIAECTREFAVKNVALIKFYPDSKVNNLFVKHILASPKMHEHFSNQANGATQKFISLGFIRSIKIPLPPFAIQKQIVEKLEGYQRIIVGAKAVVAAYKPEIEIDPEWEMVALDTLCTIVRGSSPRPAGDPRYYGGHVPRLMVADCTRDGMYVTPKIDFLTQEGAMLSRPMLKGDLVMAVSGQPGLCAILEVDACIHDGFAGFRNLDKSRVLTPYAYFALSELKEKHSSQSEGAIFQNLKTDQLREFRIPLPSISIQQAIVRSIEQEQNLIAANIQLIALYEEKIKKVVASLWGKTNEVTDTELVEELTEQG